VDTFVRSVRAVSVRIYVSSMYVCIDNRHGTSEVVGLDQAGKASRWKVVDGYYMYEDVSCFTVGSMRHRGSPVF
jgi:hypothetical protein